MFRLTTLSLCAFWLLPAAQAAALPGLSSLGGAEFSALSADLGAALSYKPLASGEQQRGAHWTIDYGVSMTALTEEGLAALQRATGGEPATYDLALAVRRAAPLPRLQLARELPDRVHLAVTLSPLPWAMDAYVAGGALRMTFAGAAPASLQWSARAALTRLYGVRGFTFMTRSLDIGLSKPLRAVTPYAGVGKVWIRSSVEAPGPGAAYPSMIKAYVGLRLGSAARHYSLEIDRTGRRATLSVALGLSW